LPWLLDYRPYMIRRYAFGLNRDGVFIRTKIPLWHQNRKRCPAPINRQADCHSDPRAYFRADGPYLVAAELQRIVRILVCEIRTTGALVDQIGDLQVLIVKLIEVVRGPNSSEE